MGKFRRDYAAKNIAFAPAILSVAGKIHPEFLGLLWVLVDMPTARYFNLVGDEEDIGNERFKWSRASKFSYNRHAIGLTVLQCTPPLLVLNSHPSRYPWNSGPIQLARGDVGTSAAARPRFSHPHSFVVT